MGVYQQDHLRMRKVIYYLFNIYNLPAMAITHADNTISNVPDQSNLKIIGWTNINSDIILFSTSSDSKILQIL